MIVATNLEGKDLKNYFQFENAFQFECLKFVENLALGAWTPYGAHRCDDPPKYEKLYFDWKVNMFIEILTELVL